jgi:hypothetical protein
MRAATPRLVWVAGLLAALAVPAFAADPAPAPPGATTPEATCADGQFDPGVKTNFFPDMRERAIEVRKTLCVDGATREKVLAAFSSFVDRVVRARLFDPYGGFTEGQPLDSVEQALKTPGAPIPTVAVGVPAAGGPEFLEVAGKIFHPVNVGRCNADTQDQGCGPILDEFSAYYTYAHNSFSSQGAQAFARSVAGLSKQWSAYLDSSRSMTPLELLINSAVYKRSETLQFSPPPKIQYIVLHPSLVIENVNDAIGGEKMKEALMIELGGANWWQQNTWYLPTGGSAIMVYSDRPGISEWGYGVALHFRSVYTVGYTRHDSNDGVFISFDLLKLVQDKKKVLESFNP